MATSKRAFLIELYREYLDEASFLYEQRLSLLQDPQIAWPDIHDFEDRLEAQIDGLVVGEQLALEVCKKQASVGDFGELHAALRVFCRQRRKDLLFEALEELDANDADKVLSASNALKNECPEPWFDDLATLSRKHPKLVPILATVAGHQRLKAGSTLLRCLREAPGEFLSRVVWALGRLRERSAIVPLSELVRYEEEGMRWEAALALLRTGDSRIIDQCRQVARSESWPLICVGLGAGRSEVSPLMRMAEGKASDTCFLALGLLGDVSSVPALISHLSDSAKAAPAAQALHLITAAPLFEEVFIPEGVNEDELFEEELKRWQEGKAPTRLDGRPFGSIMKRVTQKPADWEKWWTEKRSSFDLQTRYRSGKPYSPAVLLNDLECASTSHQLRRLIGDELVIRYAMDVSFEVDTPVSEQRKMLKRIAQWVQENNLRFRAGEWYFAGSRISDNARH